MGAKKRAGSKSPTKKEETGSPKAKKAKVEPDPANDMCTELVDFFQNVGEVPASIEATLIGSIKPSLYKMKQDRHKLEQFYADVVGEVLRHSVQVIDQEVADTAAAVTAAEQAAAASNQALDQAAALLGTAGENVAKAKEAESQGKAAADQADEDRAGTQQEIEDLDTTKQKLEAEQEELKDGLRVLGEASATKKELTKLTKLLEAVGCSAACIPAVGTALGKTEGFEGMVLNEAKKAVQAKLDEVGGKLASHDQTVAATHQKLTDTDAKIAQLAEALTQRKAELKTAQDAEKAAKAGKKEAENNVAKAKKEVNAKVKLAEAATGKKAAATSAQTAYDTLATRVPAPEPAPPADDDTAPPAEL